MSKRRRIEITILRRRVVRYDRSCTSPAAEPYDEDASHQDCDDSSQAEELDAHWTNDWDLLQGKKRSRIDGDFRTIK